MVKNSCYYNSLVSNKMAVDMCRKIPITNVDVNLDLNPAIDLGNAIANGEAEEKARLAAEAAQRELDRKAQEAKEAAEAAQRELDRKAQEAKEAAEAAQREADRQARAAQEELDRQARAAQDELDRQARAAQDELNRAASQASKSKWNPKNWF